MKRIARLGAEPFRAGDLPVDYGDLVRVLRPYLPPATVALFARPKAVEGGVVEWYSELGGQPVPFSQLPPAEADRVQRLLDERLSSIMQLADRLQSQGGDGPQQAALLRQAVQYPDTRTLYSLNGQPVLTFWGHSLQGVVPGVMQGVAPGSVPVIASPAAADAQVALPSGPPQPVVTNLPPLPPQNSVPAQTDNDPQRKRRRWWPWLLLALLMLGLLATLLWWLYCRDAEPAAPQQESPAMEQPEETEQPAETPVVPEPKPDDTQQEAPLPLQEPVTEEPAAEAPPAPAPPPPDPLDELTQKVEATQDCAALQTLLLQEEQQLQDSDPRAVALKQQIAETLNGRCKQEQARQQQAQQQEQQAKIQQAKTQCPGQRPPELAPELIIVFDASGSMNEKLPLTAQEQVQRKVTQDVIGGLGGLIGGSAGGAIGRTVEKAVIKEAPTRMSAAKEAALTVVRKTPRDTSIGLVKIEGCPKATSAGYYSPAQRGSLTGLIQSLEPQQGTPLADGIAKGGEMLDGVNRASLMVVISDGQESCGADPCAVAKQLARTKPNLKINVVDIMGTGAGTCVAQATGGRVFTAKSVNELNMMVTQAAQDVLGPANCP